MRTLVTEGEYAQIRLAAKLFIAPPILFFSFGEQRRKERAAPGRRRKLRIARPHRKREGSFAPLLLLSPRNPLCWACAGTPEKKRKLSALTGYAVGVSSVVYTLRPLRPLPLRSRELGSPLG